MKHNNIKIKKPMWKGYKYSLWYNKGYGCMSGGCSEYKTKEELITAIKGIIEDWEKYDSILGRDSDKVTLKNLNFESFTDEITTADILGNKKLGEWIK